MKLDTAKQVETMSEISFLKSSPVNVMYLCAGERATIDLTAYNIQCPVSFLLNQIQ